MQLFSPIDTALEAIVRTASEIWSLFKIYWLPWLLGTCALMAVDIVSAEQFSRKSAPDWLATIVWAPFAATVEVLVLRLVLRGDRPRRGISLEWSGVSAIVAAVLSVWGLLALSLDAAEDAVRGGLVTRTLAAATSYDKWMQEIMPAVYALLVIKWLLKALLAFAVYGLVAVAVDLERFDFAANLRLILKQPMKLFLLVCLAGGAISGFEFLYSELFRLLGGAAHYPYPDPTLPRRENVLAAVSWHLGQFPLVFLTHVSSVVLLGVTYRRLKGVQAMPSS